MKESSGEWLCVEGKPRGIKRVIAFLASEESSYVIGTEIIVSGGIDLFTLVSLDGKVALVTD